MPEDGANASSPSGRGVNGGPSIESKHSAADSEYSMLGLSHIKKSPHWSFPAKPEIDRNTGVPGPGAYEMSRTEATSSHAKGPNFTFGMSGREVLGKQKAPGPGSYNHPATAMSNKAYTMSPRLREQRAASMDLPGPGAHDVRATFGGGPKYTASPRCFAGGKSNGSPGPGAYDVNEGDNLRSRQPRACFGTGSRLINEAASTMTPGPGSYSVRPDTWSGPQVSIKARYQSPRAYVTPGPGAHGGHYSSFGDYRPSMPRANMASTLGSARGKH
mmetsp:Transcript_83484/g.174695  ORF Transcript_83484/g.174695 Transcript_83484/m.174695 type:complete len:273 (+) Transcript_83484:107-925(+)